MAHFDVHATIGRDARGTPYVVVVQSSRFDQRPSRVVIPLVVLNASRGLDNELAPRFRIEGRSVYLNPLGILTVPTSALGRLVGSLSDDVSSGAIINAIDAVITRAYG
jgi:toxin CcdB